MTSPSLTEDATASCTEILRPITIPSVLVAILCDNATLVGAVITMVEELTDDSAFSGTPAGTTIVAATVEVLAALSNSNDTATSIAAESLEVELAPASVTEVAAVTLAALVELPAAPASGTPVLAVGARLPTDVAADAARFRFAGRETMMPSPLLLEVLIVKRAGAVTLAPLLLVEAAPVSGTPVPVVTASESLLVPAEPASAKFVCAVTSALPVEVVALVCNGTVVCADMLNPLELVEPEVCVVTEVAALRFESPSLLVAALLAKGTDVEMMRFALSELVADEPDNGICVWIVTRALSDEIAAATSSGTGALVVTTTPSELAPLLPATTTLTATPSVTPSELVELPLARGT